MNMMHEPCATFQLSNANDIATREMCEKQKSNYYRMQCNLNAYSRIRYRTANKSNIYIHIIQAKKRCGVLLEMCSCILHTYALTLSSFDVNNVSSQP